MQKLYSQCLETSNIEKAIRVVFSHEGAKTAGADSISKSSKISQERIIKEVKLRLRRYKSVQSRKVHILKDNGEYRELTIINLFARIAQQAVYQIISPLLEGQMSKHSYKRHKDDWIEWNLQRGKKICCRYYRYADDTFITRNNEAEQKYIADVIS